MKNDFLSSVWGSIMSTARKAVEHMPITEASVGRAKDKLQNNVVPAIRQAKDTFIHESAATIGRGKERFQHEVLPSILKAKDTLIYETVPSISLRVKSFADAAARSIQGQIPKDFSKLVSTAGNSLWAGYLLRVRHLCTNVWQFLENTIRNGRIADVTKKLLSDMKNRMPK